MMKRWKQLKSIFVKLMENHLLFMKSVLQTQFLNYFCNGKAMRVPGCCSALCSGGCTVWSNLEMEEVPPSASLVPMKVPCT